jgi:Contractile injection system tube protein/LysM domain
MALEKLTIECADEPAAFEPILALFNPERYTLSKGVQFAEIAIPGLDGPLLQFVRGQNEKITMELFFDTTERGMVEDVKDVREETGKVYGLLKINRDTHAPPRCRLLWGGRQLFSHTSKLLSPRCVVESVTEEFQLFSPGGVPLRAKLNVSFREYKTLADDLKETPRHSSDRTKIVTVKRGQTLSHIAWQEYRDAGAWRPIAETNGLANPRWLAPGTKLTIPRLTPGDG